MSSFKSYVLGFIINENIIHLSSKMDDEDEFLCCAKAFTNVVLESFTCLMVLVMQNLHISFVLFVNDKTDQHVGFYDGTQVIHIDIFGFHDTTLFQKYFSRFRGHQFFYNG